MFGPLGVRDPGIGRVEKASERARERWWTPRRRRRRMVEGMGEYSEKELKRKRERMNVYVWLCVEVVPAPAGSLGLGWQVPRIKLVNDALQYGAARRPYAPRSDANRARIGAPLPLPLPLSPTNDELSMGIVP